MGSRGNIVILQETRKDDKPRQQVVFYSHWTGHKLLEVVKKALARELRWNDLPYLTRMIFCEMLKDAGTNEDALTGETGFGISTDICDENYPPVIVDTEQQTVYQRGGSVQSFRELVGSK